ncbi:DnaJ family domain-containing protein [Desulfovirgula thermocuniculi]|uniref:DnaJ family domain-containing protein n=1 Tax=Desulfovirgula thermocuniculi TaxID=348842 RepID=UPI0004252CA3|nr:DnaJ family domain-containing protein [Desulfovirgula thermocuniculi]
MDILTKIAEEKIREAMQKGEFDNLPGKGKPLKLDDLAHVPEELRAGYIVLKNAGVLPEEMQLKKEIVTLQQLLNYCYAEEEQLTIKKKLSEKILRFNILMERRKRTSASLRMYREKIYRKFGYRDLF